MTNPEQFLQLVKEGVTYREIGERFGYTKCWIYLELKNNYSRQKIKDALKEGKKLRVVKIKPLIEIICLTCKKPKKTKYRYYTRTFCSTKCRKAFFKKQWQK